MNRQGHEDVTYFIGPEVEHTPAYSKRTLFVVGKPKLDQIERMAREYKTPHIFMGANHSFSSASQDPYWDHVITALLDRGFWVTLDYQAHEHATVLGMLNRGIWQCRTFVPLLGVRIPKVQTSNPNLTVKIDDIDFAATNPGVWCLHHNQLTDSNRFTDWQDYGTDEVLSPMAGPVPDPVLRVPVPAPVYADINKPALNIEGIRDAISADNAESTVDDKVVGEEHVASSSGVEMNPQDLGLDLEPKIAPEVEEVLAASTTTPAQTAEEYANTAEPAKKKGKK